MYANIVKDHTFIWFFSAFKHNLVDSWVYDLDSFMTLILIDIVCTYFVPITNVKSLNFRYLNLGTKHGYY